MKAQDFSGRPQDFMINHLSENKGVVLADYGPHWKDHQRFALMTLRNFGLGKQSMEERILEEISHLVADLDKNAGGTVNPQNVFHNVASNVISLVLFGSCFDYNDEFLQQYIQLITEISKIINRPWIMGTVIITNLTTILKEEGQWKFPHEFNPDNFLNEQGQFEKPEAFIPFSTGPRVCLGEGLARMELFLIMVTLLRRFQFAWPDDAGEPDYTPVYGVTLTPKPYRMHIRRRERVKQ
ncbi:hypothetical protein cypCar_00007121 [Cyprinus carpio]|nr:hypothetical protein cypCar_00007121 [Cyprinus carpio]